MMLEHDMGYWRERGEREQRFEEKAEAFDEARGMALAIIQDEINRRTKMGEGDGYARQALETARSRIEREVRLA